MRSLYILDEDVTANEAIEKDKPLSEIRPDPYTLPQGFVWDTLTLDNPQTVNMFLKLELIKTNPKFHFSFAQLQELYQLLNENYVEDDDNMFRFDYSADFLLW